MTPRYFPDFRSFKDKMSSGNIIPVYRTLMADTLTPVSAYRKIADSPYSFLLESASGPEKIGRYCFIGSSPFAHFRVFGKKVEIQEGERVRSWDAEEPFTDFRNFLQKIQLARVEGLPSLACGAVGYMGYDVVRYVEDLPGCPTDDRGAPDMYFMFFDEMLVFDHLNKTLKVVCSVRTEGETARGAYDDATDRVDALIDKLRTPIDELSRDVEQQEGGGLDYESNFRHEDYLQVVDRCKEYIRGGDVFQVVPSQRLKVKAEASGFDIYRALRVINPSPYMFLLKMGDLQLVGSSPEVMTRVEGRRVTVRPIAGTRRRGANEREDEMLGKELLSDPKERAEHIMLIDLGRNDLGRVCKYGSISLDEVMVIERYSHVMHIVSNVSGELMDGQDALDALLACLPAGTLTGAPKVRAMEIIDEVEPTKRGPYGGAVGYFDFSGDMDTCIAIRTIVLKDDYAYMQAGGGVVADSRPELEYKETMNKAKALLRAIQVARGG